MGTDIHLCVEVREDGRWKSVDQWFEEDGFLEQFQWGANFERLAGPFYYDRNYHLFAILANVRNGYGAKIGDPVKPIEMPRGIPDDASPEVQRFVEEWGADGHSHSWFTTEELMKFDWTQRTRSGVPYYELCCTFLGEMMPKLWNLGSPDSVRIVFFFDN